MELNIGFLERFKKIKASFRNRKLNFFEHVRGKNWKNIKKMCPPLKYEAFILNHEAVFENNIKQWKEMNHKYLIREVKKIPMKNWAFWLKEFKKSKNIALLPCLDIVHFKCLKNKFKGFMFFQKKNQDCVCELNLQEMYNSIKDFLNY